MTKSNITLGSVFLLKEIYEWHRYFVIGQDKNNKDTLLYVTATSQVEKKRQFVKKNPWQNPESLIIIDPEQYKSTINNQHCSLNKSTAFNCNDAEIIYTSRLKDAQPCSPMSDTLLQQLQEATKASPMIEPYIKEMME